MFERFFWNDDSTLTDQTIEWSNPFTATALWDAKSYLYVSSFLPFNHKYFDISAANDQAGTLTVEIWYNNEWTSVVDIIDYTHDGTRSLGQSGNIFFTLDEDKGWDQEDDSSDITELSTTKVYNVYWMRFGYNASTDSALTINYIGHKFCDDTELYTNYPMLNNDAIKTQFKAGKTDWIDQEISASRAIISDLRSRNIICSKDQILDSRRYQTACMHKTAEIIFSGLGDSYVDDKNEARKDYRTVMNEGNFLVDSNKNGRLDRSENNQQTWMTR